jgi:hypothetical protein
MQQAMLFFYIAGARQGGLKRRPPCPAPQSPARPNLFSFRNRPLLVGMSLSRNVFRNAGEDRMSNIYNEFRCTVRKGLLHLVASFAT